MDATMPDDQKNQPDQFGILREAADRWFGAGSEILPVGSAPHLVRIRAGGSDYALRAWPLPTASEQVNLVARALTLAHPVCGERLPRPVPAPGHDDGWSLHVEHRLVSAATWVPGRPLARYGDYRTPDGDVIDVPLPASAPAPAVVLEAARTIGAFHTATLPLAMGAGVTDPLARVLRNSRTSWASMRREVGDKAASAPEIRRWLRCGNRVYPVAAEYLESSAATGASTAVLHGAIWPANLLIDDASGTPSLIGVVGWSQVRIGSPLIDLAHLVVHTSGWSGAMAENVLGAYAESATLPPVERRLVPVVAALVLVPEVGRLLQLAFVDDRMIGHESQPVLRSGLKSLLTSLENLTQILAPEPEWNQRRIGAHRRARQGSPRGSGGPGTTRVRRPGSGRSRPGPRSGKPTGG